MNKMIAMAFAAVLCGILPARAQEDTKPVEAAELIRSPQKYWARSFVFADTLRTHPAGGLVKLDDRRYVSFSTVTAGKCYVAAELVNVLNDLPLDRRYQFLGTVIQYGRRFYIIVRGVSASLEAGELTLDWSQIAGSPAEYMKNQALRPVFDILTLAESAHVAYAEEKGVALAELYDPRSPHYGQALGLMRSTIMAQEQKIKLTASEMLAEYLFQMLVARHPASAKPAEAAVAPAAEPSAPESPAVEAPAPAPAEPSATVEPPVEEKPRRLTRAERRELARQKKAAAAAEKAEQKRRAAEPPASEEAAGLGAPVEATRLEIPDPPAEAPAANPEPESPAP